MKNDLIHDGEWYQWILAKRRTDLSFFSSKATREKRTGRCRTRPPLLGTRTAMIGTDGRFWDEYRILVDTSTHFWDTYDLLWDSLQAARDD